VNGAIDLSQRITMPLFPFNLNVSEVDPLQIDEPPETLPPIGPGNTVTTVESELALKQFPL
jgi:hypothetical protein